MKKLMISLFFMTSLASSFASDEYRLHCNSRSTCGDSVQENTREGTSTHQIFTGGGRELLSAHGNCKKDVSGWITFVKTSYTERFTQAENIDTILEIRSDDDIPYTVHAFSRKVVGSVAQNKLEYTFEDNGVQRMIELECFLKKH